MGAVRSQGADVGADGFSRRRRQDRGKAVPGVSVRTGYFETPSLPVSVRGPDGSVALISPEPILLTVNSVLSSHDEELKDLRPPADLSTPFWERPIVVVVLVVVVLAFAGGTVFVLYRRSRRAGKPYFASPDLRTPREVAIQKLDRIASLDLPRKGDMEEHYTLVAGVLRRYVGATYLPKGDGARTEDMSTEEISAVLRQTRLDHSRAELVMELLQEADLVKFANHEPTVVRAREVESLVRELVDLTAPAFSNTAHAGAAAARGAAP